MQSSKPIYIVTGVFGHLGNTLARMLLKRGETLRGLALPQENAATLSGDLTIMRGDVREIDTLRPLFENTDNRPLIVIHTAGIITISAKFNQTVYDVNVTGTKNMLLLCREYNVSKLIHVSSVHAIPAGICATTELAEIKAFNPAEVEGLYAKTKAIATRMVLKAAAAGLPVCVVQPSGIIGPFDYGKGHITQMVIDYLKGRLVACVKGGYDFVDVRDVAIGIISCIEKGIPGDCYILSNRFVSVEELLYMLHTITGHKRVKLVLPMWLALATAPLAECYYKILGQPPLFTSYSLYTLRVNGNFSHRKASEILDYNPRPFEATLRDTVAWLKEKKRI